MAPVGGELLQRQEYEGPLARSRVRQLGPAAFSGDPPFEIDQIKIENASLVPPTASAAEARLDLVKSIKKVRRGEVRAGVYLSHAIDEPGLVGKGHRGAAIPVGAAHDPYTLLLQPLQGRLANRLGGSELGMREVGTNGNDDHKQKAFIQANLESESRLKRGRVAPAGMTCEPRGAERLGSY